MSDGMRLVPCQNCNAAGWIAHNGDWVRCEECNPLPIPKATATVLTFSRGAKVKRPVVDNDLPPAA